MGADVQSRRGTSVAESSRSGTDVDAVEQHCGERDQATYLVSRGPGRNRTCRPAVWETPSRRSSMSVVVRESEAEHGVYGSIVRRSSLTSAPGRAALLPRCNHGDMI